VQSPGFVFRDVVDIIDPFFDVDQPPIGPLVDELELLLTGARLADLQLLAACLDQDIRLPSGASGIDAVAALLYGLINEPGFDLAGKLQSVELLADPQVAQILDAVVTRLETDSALREAMKPGVRFLLTSAFAPG